MIKQIETNIFDKRTTKVLEKKEVQDKPKPSVDLEENSINISRKIHFNHQKELSMMPKPNLQLYKSNISILNFFKPKTSVNSTKTLKGIVPSSGLKTPLKKEIKKMAKKNKLASIKDHTSNSVSSSFVKSGKKKSSVKSSPIKSESMKTPKHKLCGSKRDSKKSLLFSIDPNQKNMMDFFKTPVKKDPKEEESPENIKTAETLKNSSTPKTKKTGTVKRFKAVE